MLLASHKLDAFLLEKEKKIKQGTQATFSISCECDLYF